ncbi:MAG: hypothetical protein JKY32_07820 [Rhizobiales bacterium]|nr:hypothetical protein [Hyphomicrobiales bacterium]
MAFNDIVISGAQAARGLRSRLFASRSLRSFIFKCRLSAACCFPASGKVAAALLGPSRSLRSSGKYAVGYVVYGLMFMAVGVFLGVLVISTTSFKPGRSGCGERKNCVEIYQTSAKSDYSRLVQVSPKPGFLTPEGGF